MQAVLRLSFAGGLFVASTLACAPGGNGESAVINRANAQATPQVLESDYQQSIQAQQANGEPVVQYAQQPASEYAEAPSPPCFTYVTKEGDTLGAIAYSYGYDLSAVPIIQALNGLHSDVIGVGQTLNIPQKVGNVIGCEPAQQQ